MSFILDALKRSERERRKGAADVLNADRQIAAVTRRRAWPNAPMLVSAVAAMLVVGGLGLWFTTDKPVPAEVPQEAGAPEPVPAVAEAGEIAPQPAGGGSVVRAPSETPDVAQQEAPGAGVISGAGSIVTPSLPEPSSPQLNASPEGDGNSSDKAPFAAAAAPGRGPDASGGGAAERLPRLRELAYEERESVMPLRLDVHVYDPDPQRRFVMINGKTLVGGSEIKPGLRIREILRAGVVLEWKGEAFLLTSDE